MNPTAYPLQWPAGWPRTELRQSNSKMRTTLPAALNFLTDELGRLGARDIVLSSNYTLGVNAPKDPGVAAYFTLRQKSYAIPCDRWSKIEHNVQAIALTVEAMRGMDRWGAKNMIEAMFSGFKALPTTKEDRQWWEVLGVNRLVNYDDALTAYRAKAKQLHPDAGGSHEAMTELNLAWSKCAKEKGWS